MHLWLQQTCRTLSPSASRGAWTSLIMKTLWERLDSLFRQVFATFLFFWPGKHRRDSSKWVSSHVQPSAKTDHSTTGLIHLLREKINRSHFLARADPEASSARSVTSTIILAEFFSPPSLDLILNTELKLNLLIYLSRRLEMPPEQIWLRPPCSQPRTCCDLDPPGEAWTELV